LSRW